MKLLTGIVCFSAAFFLFFGCSQEEEYIRYRNDDYKFRVDLPADSTPVETRHEVLDTDNNTVDYFISYSQDIILIIGAARKDGISGGTYDVWEQLNRAAGSVIKGGEVIERNRFRLNSYPALMVTFTRSERENRLYDTLLVTETEEFRYQAHIATYKRELLTSPEAVRFLSSFKSTSAQ